MQTAAERPLGGEVRHQRVEAPRAWRRRPETLLGQVQSVDALEVGLDRVPVLFEGRDEADDSGIGRP